MTRQVIDDTFAGLAYPRQSFSVGRQDLADYERPGPFVIALITAMTQDGKLDYEADVGPGVTHDYVPFPDAPRPGADFRTARYFDDEDDVTLAS